MKVTILDADDWIGVYLDGILIEEGHSFRLQDILSKIGVENTTVWHEGDDLDKFGGHCPALIEDYFKNYPQAEE
ncbi:MAG: hypothetical protein HRF40_10085 [Nitrososphaera sp.]|jgi:hypothetical protein